MAISKIFTWHEVAFNDNFVFIKFLEKSKMNVEILDLQLLLFYIFLLGITFSHLSFSLGMEGEMFPTD